MWRDHGGKVLAEIKADGMLANNQKKEREAALRVTDRVSNWPRVCYGEGVGFSGE